MKILPRLSAVIAALSTLAGMPAPARSALSMEMPRVEYNSEFFTQAGEFPTRTLCSMAVWSTVADTKISRFPAAYNIPAPVATWLFGASVFGMVMIRRNSNRKYFSSL